MPQQRQTGSVSELDRSDTPHRLDRRGPSRALGWSAASVAAFLVSALILGVLAVSAMPVSPARKAEALERLSAAWTQLVAPARPGAELQRTLATLQPRPSTGPAPAATEMPPGQNAIAYGDRLKVTFFESVAVSLGDPAPGEPAPVTIFPRMDLSGEYVVDEAGRLDIPRLGWRTVAGQGVGGLETQLASAFQSAFGRPGDVHVALLDRRPVYVLGGPRGGAAIKHAPGMIVLQALAEAGGHQRGASDTSRAIEAIREGQRLGETQDKLARALVRHARLTAMRDGLPAVTLPPAAAALLAEALPQDAAELLYEANATLALERRAHADRIGFANRQVDIANLELATHNMRAAQAGALAESKASRLRGLEGIAARGSVSQFKLMDATVEVAEAAAKQEDLRATVAQAQSRLIEAEVARAKFVQAYTSQVALDVASAAQEVGDIRRAVSAMRAVVAVLSEGQDAQPTTEAGPPKLRVVRRGPGGTLVIPASGTMPLMPGDVLQIGGGGGSVQADTPDAYLQPSGPSGGVAQPDTPGAQF